MNQMQNTDIQTRYGYSPGAADVTALVADRIVREALTGIALRRAR